MESMAKIIGDLSYRQSPFRTFSDFVEMSAIAFSNAVDHAQYSKREQRYLDIVKQYGSKEVAEFPRLLGLLTMKLEEGPHDVLGSLYHELELHNEQNGQYFTPEPLCRMMAKFTVGDTIQDHIGEKGFVTVNEPACGSGAMVIGVVNELIEQKINYQQHVHVVATDIDACCVHMAYTQFSLLHLPAVLVHGNSLSLEEYGHWLTPAHIMGGWSGKLKQRGASWLTTAKELVSQAQSLENPSHDIKTLPALNQPNKQPSKLSEPGIQLRLFD